MEKRNIEEMKAKIFRFGNFLEYLYGQYHYLLDIMDDEGYLNTSEGWDDFYTAYKELEEILDY